uniref:Chemokine interleukin-8-like domain-containing protein n=1 Tax=Amphilophus citrinellus TaxID=61819 RepID=A0A3Q0S021_AMPCI
MKMVDSGRLLVLVCTVWVVVAMSGPEANIFDFCCPAVTTQEIREPILGYFDQRANPPCVTAIIFYTQSGLFCRSWRAPWVLRKIVEFEKAKARPSTLSEFSLSPLSLLSIRTPTASPLIFTGAADGELLHFSTSALLLYR